mgnify:CR=1 FL=1
MNPIQTVALEDSKITHQLAQFIVDSQYEDLPSDVLKEASRGIINCLGCAIGAAQHDTVQFALAAFEPFFGAPQAQIWGRSVL